MPRRRVVGAMALVPAVTLDVAATWLLAGAMGTASDLFPRWFGTRAWLFEGMSPYAAPVDEGIRAAMGGAPGEPLGAFVFGFVYPGYVALLLAPLVVLPFRAAATLWLLLAQAAIGVGTVLAWRAHEVEAAAPRRSVTPALLVALVFPASLANVVFGQFAALVYGALCVAWWLFARRADLAAGAILALATVKPSLALLPVVALLAYAAFHRRWRVLAAWLAVTAAWWSASLVLLPSWPAEFWRSTVDYARVARAVSASGLLTSLLAPDLAAAESAARVVFGALALGIVVWAWMRSPRRAGDALAAGVLAGAWVVPPLYEWNSVLLLVPLVTWLRERSAYQAHRLALGVIVISVASLVPVLLWPYASRLLWPTAVLAGWVLQAAYRGRQNVAERTGTSPSVPAGAYAPRSASSTPAT